MHYLCLLDSTLTLGHISVIRLPSCSVPGKPTNYVYIVTSTHEHTQLAARLGFRLPTTEVAVTHSPQLAARLGFRLPTTEVAVLNVNA